jgi:hypothetical protein
MSKCTGSVSLPIETSNHTTELIWFLAGRGKTEMSSMHIKHSAMMCGGNGGIVFLFRMSALDGSEWSAPCLVHFNVGERASVAVG